MLDAEGNGDVLWKDESGAVRSVKSKGATVSVIQHDNGGTNWLVMYPVATMQVYSFTPSSLTALFYESKVGDKFLSRNSLFASNCNFR
jgi:hypothetical protein